MLQTENNAVTSPYEKAIDLSCIIYANQIIYKLVNILTEDLLNCKNLISACILFHGFIVYSDISILSFRHYVLFRALQCQHI